MNNKGKKQHPIQPLEPDKNGRMRFKKNAIVEFLLDKGPFDMNVLAGKDFPQEDWVQFAQLIGYSLDGFGELSYVTDDVYETAVEMTKPKVDALVAENRVLQQKLEKVRTHLKKLIPHVFRIHPDDLQH